MRNYDICIIGGGASGLAVAASLSSHFHTVLLEKNGILGRKIMATGGGRCNITNTACAHCDLTLDFFKSLGMELYHDTEGRYYPYSNQARDVARVLEEADGDRVRRSAEDQRRASQGDGTPVHRRPAAGGRNGRNPVYGRRHFWYLCHESDYAYHSRKGSFGAGIPAALSSGTGSGAGFLR